MLLGSSADIFLRISVVLFETTGISRWRNPRLCSIIVSNVTYLLSAIIVGRLSGEPSSNLTKCFDLLQKLGARLGP